MITVAEIAARHDLRLDNSQPGGPRYIGRNPFEPGGGDPNKPSHLCDSFHLFPPGSTLDGKDMGGCAWQRTPRRFYTSRQIAEFEGIAYEEYEGALSDPKYKGDQTYYADHTRFDTRSLEERGLTREAQQNFMISGPLMVGSKWGERREWPTFYPDGTRARKRRKYRYPALQLSDEPTRKPRKCDWDNNTKELGMPVAYGINWIDKGEEIWLVNSELAVWLFWQEGLTAICPLGEGRNSETYYTMLSEAAKRGASVVNIMLDNDLGGRMGSVRAYDAAQKLQLPCQVYDLSAMPKIGFDASDLWEWWQSGSQDNHLVEGLSFAEILVQQPLAKKPSLDAWRMGVAHVDTQAEVAKTKKEARKLGDKIVAAKDAKESPAATLLEMLRKHQLFHTNDGGRGIVIQSENGRKTTFDIQSGEFSEWVCYTYFLETGQVVRSEVVKQALSTLSSLARYEGEKLNAYNRIAGAGGRYYLDLCNDDGEVVEIDADGWRVTSECPVFFRRSVGMQEIPRPERRRGEGGNFEVWQDFRNLLNYGDERNWILIVAWMISALVPDRWPCPILAIHGEQGSAKSWLTRLVRQTVDPNDGFMVQYVKEERDVVIVAEKARVFALDNQENMPAWLSNLLAAMVTGTPYMCRTLFTNDELKIFKGQPAMILNGIPEKIGGIDFNDRALKMFIPKVVDKGYRREAVITNAWESLRPNLMAAILDAMVCGLANKDRQDEIVSGRHLPRMADFATWVMCCEDALPFPADSFYNAYTENIVTSAGADLETLFPQCIIEMVRLQGDFEGTAGELHEILCNVATGLFISKDMANRAFAAMNTYEQETYYNKCKERADIQLSRVKEWPKTAGALGTMLPKIAPSLLKSANINCERGQRTTTGVRWTVRRIKDKDVFDKPQNTEMEFDPFEGGGDEEDGRNSRDSIYGKD